MRATIDAGGRVVVPKSIRDRLNLQPGMAVELTDHDGWLEIAPVITPMSLQRRDGVLVATTDAPMPVLTADVVRDTIERGRR